jgi:hypothetical protein
VKTTKEQDHRNPKQLTNWVPLLTSQPDKSWLKAVASENIKYCEGEWCHMLMTGSSSDVFGQREEWCETFSLILAMSMIIIQNA